MLKYKISISFKQKYLDIYTILKSKDNISLYICELVRADSATSKEDLEFKVEQILNKLLKDKQLIFNDPGKLTKDTCNKTTDEDVDLILNLF